MDFFEFSSFQFFSPLVPVKVEFEYNSAGKPTGEANVDFSTHQEAKEAMKKHKANMRKSETQTWVSLKNEHA